MRIFVCVTMRECEYNTRVFTVLSDLSIANVKLPTASLITYSEGCGSSNCLRQEGRVRRR